MPLAQVLTKNTCQQNDRPTTNGFHMTATARFTQEALPQMAALQSFALQLCKDEQHSHDLVQDTMLKAFMYFHTYREGTNCRAWLFQICKNSFINEIRKKQHEPMAIDFQEEESGDRLGGDKGMLGNLKSSVSNEYAGGLAMEAFGDEVSRALEVLPADYQTVIILCDIEGLTYDEIADFMQTPVGTIRSRIHRGRRLLAERLMSYARARGYSSQMLASRN
jgi:RNA polymerase sigma-70 factor, ECF subfamily